MLQCSMARALTAARCSPRPDVHFFFPENPPPPGGASNCLLQCSMARALTAARCSRGRRSAMPGKHTSKEKRKARHIEKGYEKKGVSHREAEHRAWATVNKQDK